VGDVSKLKGSIGTGWLKSSAYMERHWEESDVKFTDFNMHTRQLGKKC